MSYTNLETMMVRFGKRTPAESREGERMQYYMTALATNIANMSRNLTEICKSGRPGLTTRNDYRLSYRDIVECHTGNLHTDRYWVSVSNHDKVHKDGPVESFVHTEIEWNNLGTKEVAVSNVQALVRDNSICGIVIGHEDLGRYGYGSDPKTIYAMMRIGDDFYTLKECHTKSSIHAKYVGVSGQTFIKNAVSRMSAMEDLYFDAIPAVGSLRITDYQIEKYCQDAPVFVEA